MAMSMASAHCVVVLDKDRGGVARIEMKMMMHVVVRERLHDAAIEIESFESISMR